jgi:hypothetical protein
VLLRISPVEDFDRLLGLDDALRRLAYVSTVTLADYAAESVSFRLELSETTSPEALARDIAGSAGAVLRVVSVEPGGVSLELA